MTNTYNIGNGTLSSILPGTTVGGTITLPNIPSNGAYLTSGTSTSYSWSNPNSTNVMFVKTDPAELEVKGRVVINGQDLEERLKTIEKVLQIPERDVKLEAKHPKLKELYDAYIHALGKYRTWDAIKGEDND
jgi:hypothetical protein